MRWNFENCSPEQLAEVYKSWKIVVHPVFPPRFSNKTFNVERIMSRDYAREINHWGVLKFMKTRLQNLKHPRFANHRDRYRFICTSANSFTLLRVFKWEFVRVYGKFDSAEIFGKWHARVIRKQARKIPRQAKQISAI